MVSDKKRRQAVRLGKKGFRLREIEEETGISIPAVSEILRGEGVKSYFYVQYEKNYGRPYDGHFGRPFASEFPKGYVTSSEAARILGVERGHIYSLLNKGHRLEGYKNGSYQFISVKSIHKYVYDIFKDAVERGQKIRKLRS